MLNSTTKKVLVFLLINGCLWVWCSYALAFLGKGQIAETLSVTAITEILGVFLTYSAKALFENLSKFNHWPDKGCSFDTLPDNNWEGAKGTDE